LLKRWAYLGNEGSSHHAFLGSMSECLLIISAVLIIGLLSLFFSLLWHLIVRYACPWLSPCQWYITSLPGPLTIQATFYLCRWEEGVVDPLPSLPSSGLEHPSIS